MKVEGQMGVNQVKRTKKFPAEVNRCSKDLWENGEGRMQVKGCIARIQGTRDSGLKLD